MYNCKVCDFSTKSVLVYVAHYRFHRHVNNLRFPCGLQHCMRTFATYSFCNRHVTTDHSEQRRHASDMQHRNADIPLQCQVPFCTKECPDLHSLLMHQKQHLAQGTMINWHNGAEFWKMHADSRQSSGEPWYQLSTGSHSTSFWILLCDQHSLSSGYFYHAWIYTKVCVDL